MLDLLVLSLIGLVVGLAGGLFGIGGSIVLIPAVTEYLGPDQHRYQAAAMIVNFFVAAPAVVQHRRANAIDAGMVGRLIPLAILGVIVGVGLSELPIFAGSGEPWLRLLFGLFVLASALAELYRVAKPWPAQATVGDGEDGTRGWPKVGGVAVPTGIVAGLLGVGGGVVAVPLQRKLMRLPMRQAIANSAAMLAVSSLIGCVVKNGAYYAETGSWGAVLLAIIVIPGAVVGSLAGSYAVHRMPVKVLRNSFILLLLLAAARFIWGAARTLRLDAY